jgi:hypothetical protein
MDEISNVMKLLPNSEYKDSPGIWMIHIVEEIKLLLLYKLLYVYIKIGWCMLVW